MEPVAALPPPAEAHRPSIWQHLRELYAYRGLTYNLVLRELRARYKNSIFGFLWSLLNPLGMMLVFTFVFTVMMPNSAIPNFPIFFLCGYLPWQYFSGGVMGGAHSIVANSNLVKKVYFPRDVLPISTVMAALVNFLLALVVLFGALIITKTRLSPYIWMLPVVILIQTMFTLGIAFIVAALNVFYRDTVMILEIVLQAWFFLTPIFYPIEVLPRSYEFLGMTVNVHRMMYILNPMASIVAAYRALLYWGYRTDLDFLMRTAVTTVLVLAVGYWFFLRLSPRFAEEV
jgi:ABC-type polysaccharide/polyol phosphate export permease